MKRHGTKFSAVVEIDAETEFAREVNITVELDKPETELMYDEVEDAIYAEAEARFGSQYYSTDDDDGPDWLKIIEIVVWADDGELYPVVPDSLESKIKDMHPGSGKVLILPEIRYTLTPEAKMHLDLMHAGVIAEDAPFDFEKYHLLVEKQKQQK